jgi:hypothetical protein
MLQSNLAGLFELQTLTVDESAIYMQHQVLVQITTIGYSYYCRTDRNLTNQTDHR